MTAHAVVAQAKLAFLGGTFFVELCSTPRKGLIPLTLYKKRL